MVDLLITLDLHVLHFFRKGFHTTWPYLERCTYHSCRIVTTGNCGQLVADRCHRLSPVPCPFVWACSSFPNPLDHRPLAACFHRSPSAPTAAVLHYHQQLQQPMAPFFSFRLTSYLSSSCSSFCISVLQQVPLVSSLSYHLMSTRAELQETMSS